MERAPCTGTLGLLPLALRTSRASGASPCGLPLPASQRAVRRLLGSLVPPSVPSSAASANSTGRALPTGLREMYLNIDSVAAHEPRTASCRFCPPAAGLYRAPSLHLDRRWRRASACCCATRPFCFHLPPHRAHGLQRIAANHPAR
jgi:hypothetical protein